MPSTQPMIVIAGVRHRVQDARARGLVDDKNQLTAEAKAAQKDYDAAQKRRLAYSESNSRRRTVTNRAPVGSEQEVEIPEGDPSGKWTVAQLDAYATREGFEVSGDKAEKLGLLTTALADRQAEQEAEQKARDAEDTTGSAQNKAGAPDGNKGA